jgi:hypothetical protein
MCAEFRMDPCRILVRPGEDRMFHQQCHSASPDRILDEPVSIRVMSSAGEIGISRLHFPGVLDNSENLRILIGTRKRPPQTLNEFTKSHEIPP